MIAVNGKLNTPGFNAVVSGVPSSIWNRAEDLLAGREARVFPPEGVIAGWQIFVRRSEITTDSHSSLEQALLDLICQLSERTP